MKTSTNGLVLGALSISMLLAACEGSVDPAGGGGQGVVGGEGQGGEALGGQAPLGGSDGGNDVGGAGFGGAAQGGGDVGGRGEGGASSEECALMEQVTVSRPTLVDAGGDLIWSPGEDATFSVMLTNEASSDNFNYPGVIAESAIDGITAGNNTLFGIVAGESTEVMVTVGADDGVETGTVVDLVFTVTTLSEGCGALDSVGLSVTLQ